MQPAKPAMKVQRRQIAALNAEVPEARRVAFRIGLHVGEPPVLNALDDTQGLDERGLAARLGFRRAQLRDNLRKLEASGLVQRMPGANEGAGALYRLTSAGLDTHQRLRPAIVAAMDRLMSPLSDHERDQLQMLLGRVIKADGVRGQIAAETPPPEAVES